MVDTTQSGIVMNGLSQLKGVTSKGEFSSALIRGLGSNMDIEKRTNFAKEVYTWVGENPIDKRRPLNSYYDTKTMSFRSYDVETTQDITQEQLLKEPVILTSDVRANADFVLPWLRHNDPFIVVGPEGCGKSMLLRYCFSQLKSTSVATVHCSSQTAASHVIQKLTSACVVGSSVKGRVFRPKEGDRLILYLKDINLPKPDKYETIQLIAFLQQLITYNGFYDDNLEWMALERIQIVCSMNPSSTVGRHQLTTRFTSLMRIVYIAYPSREQLQTIYSSYVDGALEKVLNKEVQIILKYSINFCRHGNFVQTDKSLQLVCLTYMIKQSRSFLWMITATTCTLLVT
jgi:dynein heavy chain 2